jgi:hypothetical protein
MVCMEGFLRADQYPRLTASDRLEIERFAHATGIGPIFDMRPLHHGQHDHCCERCNTHRQQTARKRQVAPQPWAAIELPDAA